MSDTRLVRGFHTLSEQVEGLREYAASPAQRVKTGLRTLDEMILGPAPGEVFYIAGAPGAGKSLFATNILWKNPTMPAIFFSMEMPYRLALQRFYAHWADEVASQVVEDTENNQLPYVLDTFAEKYEQHIIVDASELSLGDMSKYLAMYDEYFGQRPRLAIVDYLEALTHEEPGTGNRVEAVAQKLKAFAKHEDIPVIVLHHRNQKNEPWEEFGQNDMRYGGFRDADLVLGIWQPGLDPDLDIYEKRDLRNSIYGKITKNRINGKKNDLEPLEWKLSDSLRLVEV